MTLASCAACETTLRNEGVFTVVELVGDEGVGLEGGGHRVGLLAAGEDPSEPFGAPDEPQDLVAAPVELGVVRPRVAARLQRRHDRLEGERLRQFECFVVLVGSVHGAP